MNPQKHTLPRSTVRGPQFGAAPRGQGDPQTLHRDAPAPAQPGSPGPAPHWPGRAHFGESRPMSYPPPHPAPPYLFLLKVGLVRGVLFLGFAAVVHLPGPPSPGRAGTRGWARTRSPTFPFPGRGGLRGLEPGQRRRGSARAPAALRDYGGGRLRKCERETGQGEAPADREGDGDNRDPGGKPEEGGQAGGRKGRKEGRKDGARSASQE